MTDARIAMRLHSGCAMFDELESFLRSLKNEEFVYVPNPGNAGDSLIAYATYLFFERLSLRYEVGDHRNVYPGRIVVYGGGGNFVDPYKNANEFVLSNLPACRLLVILPHSVRGYRDTLAKMDSKCVVFCRERTSFEFVKLHTSKTEVLLSHDLALSVDSDLLRTEAAQCSDRVSGNLKYRFRALKSGLKTLTYEFRNRRSPSALNAFRKDYERTNVVIQGANLDVSYVCARPEIVLKPDAARRTTARLTRLIDRFKTVRTNRLHVGILSALLGKKVELYDNSYGKVRAVYEHSLRSRFDNITWCES